MALYNTARSPSAHDAPTRRVRRARDNGLLGSLALRDADASRCNRILGVTTVHT
jgi:hypothetical protein